MTDKILLLFFSLFNLYLLWRIDKLEKEKTSFQDIKEIFCLLVEKLGINDD